MTHVSPTIEPVYELFASRFRAARKLQGLTIAEVRRRLTRPRSHGSLRAIEEGKQRLPLHLALELAAIVGMSLAELTAPSAKRAKWEALGE